MQDDAPTARQAPSGIPWPAVAAVLAVAVVVLIVRPRPRAEPAAAEGGEVHYLLFCADATPAEGGGFNARKVIDSLTVASFPFDASPAIVVSFTPDRAGRRYKLVCTSGSGWESSRELVLSGMGGESHIVRPGTIRFEGADVLTCRVLADGKVIAERKLVVRPTPG